MLDAMERATDEGAALGDLFRLDHLTTRMRQARGKPDHPVRRDTGPGVARPGAS